MPRQHLWTRSLSKRWRLLSQQLLSGSGWAGGGGGGGLGQATDNSAEVEGRGLGRPTPEGGKARPESPGLLRGKCERQGWGPGGSCLSFGLWDHHQAAPRSQLPPRVTQRDWTPRDPSNQPIPNLHVAPCSRPAQPSLPSALERAQRVALRSLRPGACLAEMRGFDEHSGNTHASLH